MSKPSIPKGTRDFLPAEVSRRNFIFDTIRRVFEKYGYQPIETPAMEKLETLTGKYGGEGERLIFKILNSGEEPLGTPSELVELLVPFYKEHTGKNFDKADIKKYMAGRTEKALRYDLTVPFARYVAQHQNDITFPFKRYQIQPVWRADRPQKGRYREFYQCDVDVIGSESLLNEVELIQVIDDVFTALKIKNVKLKINNRKVLHGIAEVLGVQDNFTELTTALDKLDKIGTEKVMDELRKHQDLEKAINDLLPYIVLSEENHSNEEKLDKAAKLLKGSEVGKQGIEELKFIFDTLAKCQLSAFNCQFEAVLARGLNYYTGAILEVITDDFPSSLCGGGRYDDLAGIFGLPNVSGVGISFGADRIYDVMNELGLFPESLSVSTKAMFVNFGEKEAAYCLPLLRKLRDSGISAEIYPDSSKMKKQMKYANDKQVEYVALVGPKEMETGKLTVKEMQSGEQFELTVDELIDKLR